MEQEQTPQQTQQSPEASPLQSLDPSGQSSGQEPSQGQDQPDPSAPSDPSSEAAQFRREAFALRKLEWKLKERESALAEREAKAAALEAREKELAEWDGLDEWQTLERLAKKRGLNETELVRRAITRLSNGGKATPDIDAEDARAVARKALERAEALERKLQEQEEQRQAKLQAQEAETLISEYRQQTTAALTEDAYPILSGYASEQVAEAALQIADRVAAKTGEVPEVGDVLRYLEKQERDRLERLAPRLRPRETEQQPERSGGSGGALTNRAAAERGNGSPRQMSERERIAWAAEVLRKT